MIYLELMGMEKQFSISQVLPEPSKRCDKELERLFEGMKQFQTNRPREIVTTEVLSPADRRGSQGELDEAIANKLKGLAERGLYEIMCKEEVPEDAKILGGKVRLCH